MSCPVVDDGFTFVLPNPPSHQKKKKTRIEKLNKSNTQTLPADNNSRGNYLGKCKFNANLLTQ